MRAPLLIVCLAFLSSSFTLALWGFIKVHNMNGRPVSRVCSTWQIWRLKSLKESEHVRSDLKVVSKYQNVFFSWIYHVLVSLLQSAALINGEHTEIVCSCFKDRLLVVVTQYGKLGTLVSLARNWSHLMQGSCLSMI